jgi:raffinose/stachyose/melibiose transport system permease protein
MTELVVARPAVAVRWRPGEWAPRLRLARRFSTIIVVAVLAIQTYPLLWVILTALRTPADFASGNPFSLPGEWTVGNYVRAFETSDLPRYFLNSFVVTASAIALIVALSMMAAYAVQILGFRGSNAVLAFLLVGIVVPVQVALVPLFVTYSDLGLLDSRLALIIPMASFALPVSTYMFVSFMRFIPHELLEAATIDGCGPYRAFARVVLPMSGNTVVTVVFINAVFIWNDFIFANTFVFSDELKTYPLGLQDFIGAMGSTDWTATFAAISVTVTPLLLMLLALNRAIIHGLEAGAVKG